MSENLKEMLSDAKEALKYASDDDEKAMYNNAIKEIEQRMAAETEKPEKQEAKKAKKPEKPEKQEAKKAKKEWDAKMKAEFEKAVAKGEKRTYNAWLCDELGEAYKKRMKAVKKAAKQKTTPITKILADKMEGVVKSAIAYDKRSDSNMDIKELKEAVNILAKGLDKLKAALNADLKDDFINKFKEDLMTIIKALEKKQ